MLSACSETQRRLGISGDQCSQVVRFPVEELHLRRLHCGTDSRSNCSPYFIPRAGLLHTLGSVPAEVLRAERCDYDDNGRGWIRMVGRAKGRLRGRQATDEQCTFRLVRVGDCGLKWECLFRGMGGGGFETDATMGQKNRAEREV